MTREEAIKLLVNATYSDEWQGNEDLTTAHNMAIKALEQEPKWIPCSERLPEKNGVYLVCYEDVTVLLDWFNGKWFFYKRNPAVEETGTIIAWMPLPEPYEGE